MNTVNWRRVLWTSVFFWCWYTSAFAQDSLLPVLQQLRAEYPTPMSKAQVGDLLTRTARSRIGWVLYAKPDGSNCPAMNTRVSCDVLVYAATGQAFDVLRDSEGFGIPVWNRLDPASPDRYVYVDPVPVPTPPMPPPSQPELTAILETLTALDVRVQALSRTLAEQAALILAGLDVLASRPFPDYRGSL